MAIPAIGMEGQQKISASKVLVIGAGGLGCPALSYLAAIGVGYIGIIDDDKIEEKNLHRQVLYNEEDIGKSKAIVAKEKLVKQNSGIQFISYTERFNEKNAMEIVRGYEIVVDCCDNVATRYIIDTITKELDKPFVYGAVRQMEGQVSVFNYNNGPCYRQLFPDKTIFDLEQDCATAGIVGYVTGIIGCLQVNEVIKIILNGDNVLNGEVLAVDLQTLLFRKFKINKY